MTQEKTEARLSRNIQEWIGDFREDDGQLPEIDELKIVIKKEFDRLKKPFPLDDEQLYKIAEDMLVLETVIVQKKLTILSIGRKPWLETLENKTSYFGDSYKRYLKEKPNPLPHGVVDGIFTDTDYILDMLAPTNIPNAKILKKGLVMGNVQSGKTANYIALINKAVDAGYKLIILIAGVHNILRNQTQERVNEGFIGRDILKDRHQDIHVAEYRGNSEIPAPTSITNMKTDFDINQPDNGLTDHMTNPTIIVIKKHPAVLRNVMKWLGLENEHDEIEEKNIRKYPMLMIDDEADNASIDTTEDARKETTINRQLRTILAMFHVRSYVGYTATPFANIFIHPDATTLRGYDDLYPEDFIVSLDSPDNYVGAKKLFMVEGEDYNETKEYVHDENIVKPIEDIGRRGKIENGKFKTLKSGEEYGGSLVLGLKKGDKIKSIPDSLKKAIDIWILTIGIRKFRPAHNKHNTMLINISHITGIQEQVADKVAEHLRERLDTISVNANRPSLYPLDDEAKKLKELFDKEFGNIAEKKELTFYSILKIISKVDDEEKSIKIYTVNSETKLEEKLNYDDFKEKGLNPIAIGGYSLSRGFTLEGLTITYLMRESTGYDTLLQMGRWFGYRPKYEELCRVYMSKDAIGWYKTIANASEELRNTLNHLSNTNQTPRDFSVGVVASAGRLEITSATKRYNSETVETIENYSGALQETTEFYNDAEILVHNMENQYKFIRDLNKEIEPKKIDGHLMWENISIDDVIDYIVNYKSEKNFNKFLIDYVRIHPISGFDIVLVNTREREKYKSKDINYAENIQIRTKLRKAFIDLDKIIIGDNKTGLSDISHEKIGIESNKTTRNELRELRERPVLLIHTLMIKDGGAETEDKEDNSRDPEDMIYPPHLSTVAAFTILIPGSKDKGVKVKKTYNPKIERDTSNETQ